MSETYLSKEYWNGLIKMSLSKLLILRILYEESLHGYEISKRISLMTNGCCAPTEGALYPVLREFEEGEYVSRESMTIGGRQRKVYTLTEKGKEAYRVAIESWQETALVLLQAGKELKGGMELKTLKIEWRHLDVAGDTCDRCYDTGENLVQEIKRLNRALQPKGITVELTETKLDDTKIPQSNTILFNGVPIEDILDIQVSENYCDSCTNLLGTETYCRTVMFEGNEYEEIPAKAIRQAAFKVLGIEEEKKAPAGGSCCGCGSSCC